MGYKTRIKSIRTGNLVLLASMLIMLFGFGIDKTEAYSSQHIPEFQTTKNKKTYLPLVLNKAGVLSALPLMTGIYPVGWPEQSTIDNEMRPLDNWLTGVTGGRSTSIFGTFMPMLINDTIAKANVEIPLTIIWDNGYTPFVNLPAPDGATAYDVAAGKYDSQLRAWAKSYKNFAANGSRFAYMAPLQEMNGEWVSYGKDPTNFKIAYKRIQSIFIQEGVPKEFVKWVFAPNGWSRPGMPRFEEYYPGDNYVDVVAISGYNFGYCNGGIWEEPETVFNNPGLGATNGHYLDRLRALAPTKPIFIAQTASSSYWTKGTKSPSEKDRWLRDAYKYLSTQPNVKAIIYYNIDKDQPCDWSIYTHGGEQYSGYKTGVNSNGYIYSSPINLLMTDHTIR